MSFIWLLQVADVIHISLSVGPCITCSIYIVICGAVCNLQFIQGVPGGMCQTSGGCSLC